MIKRSLRLPGQASTSPESPLKYSVSPSRSSLSPGDNSGDGIFEPSGGGEQEPQPGQPITGGISIHSSLPSDISTSRDKGAKRQTRGLASVKWREQRPQSRPSSSRSFIRKRQEAPAGPGGKKSLGRFIPCSPASITIIRRSSSSPEPVNPRKTERRSISRGFSHTFCPPRQHSPQRIHSNFPVQLPMMQD